MKLSMPRCGAQLSGPEIAGRPLVHQCVLEPTHPHDLHRCWCDTRWS